MCMLCCALVQVGTLLFAHPVSGSCLLPRCTAVSIVPDSSLSVVFPANAKAKSQLLQDEQPHCEPQLHLLGHVVYMSLLLHAIHV